MCFASEPPVGDGYALPTPVCQETPTRRLELAAGIVVRPWSGAGGRACGGRSPGAYPRPVAHLLAPVWFLRAVRMKVSSPESECMVRLDVADRLAKGGFMGISPAAQPCPTSVVARSSRSPRCDGRVRSCPARRSRLRCLKAVRAGGAKRQSSSLGQQVPDQHSQLAGGGHNGDARAAPGPQAVVEAGQRTGGADGRVGRLAEEPPGVGLTGPADAPAERRPVAGLTDPGIEPEIADQLGRPCEAGDVAHCGDDGGSGHQADPRDGEEPADPLVVHHEGGDDPFCRGDLLAEQASMRSAASRASPSSGGSSRSASQTRPRTPKRSLTGGRTRRRARRAAA